jgi:mannose-6-phosphate isomerase-like protein (cupin superfamily)
MPDGHLSGEISVYSEKRPWGEFRVLEEQAGFKVKRITVIPGGRLSLQSHRHRSEHWTVVNGTATVTIGTEVKVLSRAQSADIAKGDTHRLENHHAETVEIIEVQFGDYLGEDDIIRYEDAYNRT